MLTGKRRLMTGFTLASLALLQSCGGEETGFHVELVEQPQTTFHTTEDTRPPQSISLQERSQEEAEANPVSRSGADSSHVPAPGAEPEPQRPSEPEPQLPAQPEPQLPAEPAHVTFTFGRVPASAVYVNCAWVSFPELELNDIPLGCTNTDDELPPDQEIVLPVVTEENPARCLSMTLVVESYRNLQDYQRDSRSWRREISPSAHPEETRHFQILETPTGLRIGYEDFVGDYDDSDQDHNDLVLELEFPRQLSFHLGHVDTCRSIGTKETGHRRKKGD